MLHIFILLMSSFLKVIKMHQNRDLKFKRKFSFSVACPKIRCRWKNYRISTLNYNEYKLYYAFKFLRFSKFTPPFLI